MLFPLTVIHHPRLKSVSVVMWDNINWKLTAYPVSVMRTLIKLVVNMNSCVQNLICSPVIAA